MAFPFEAVVFAECPFTFLAFKEGHIASLFGLPGPILYYILRFTIYARGLHSVAKTLWNPLTYLSIVFRDRAAGICFW